MAGEDSLREQFKEVVARLDFLERAVREQTARLYAVEQHLGLTRRPAAPEPPMPPEANQPDSPAAAAENMPPHVLKGPRPSPLPPLAAPRTQARSGSARVDLEARIGGSWFNRIGIVAIILGVGFFLKYAFENQWIGPAGRVLAGILVGVSFLILGEYLRARGYRQYAQGISGGGIGILYLAIFAAFAFYQLIGQLPAFTLMTLVTMGAVLLAARYDALPMAVLGLIGGFLTPILLSTGVDNEAGLFGYITLLDLGVLALAYFKQWRSLNHLAFFGTALIVTVWMDQWYGPGKLWTTLFFLTFFFLIFAFLPVLHQAINRRPANWPDVALVVLNAALYFGASNALLAGENRAYLSLLAVLMSAFYAGLGSLTFKRDHADGLLVRSFLGLAVFFLTLAVSLQLNGPWVTAVWALEGLALVGAGLRVESRATRYVGLLVFAAAALHWLAVDVPDYGFRAERAFTLLLNARAASCGVLIAALGATAWLYRHSSVKVVEQELGLISGLCVLGANVLAVTLLSLEANDYFEQAKAISWGNPSDLPELQQREVKQLENTKQLTLSGLWAVYGAVALIVGLTRRLAVLRFGALLLLGLTILKVFFVDLAALDRIYRIVSFIVLGAILLAVSFLYQQWQRRTAG